MEPLAKRPAYNAAQTASASSSYSCVDDDLHRALTTVGPRARKQVSDGHLTRSNIPSFSGLTVGTLDQHELRQQHLTQFAARPTQSMGNFIEKRARLEDEDGEYGDTEDDEEVFSQNTTQPTASFEGQAHSSFFPTGHRSRSTNMDDFEEANFLRPQ